MDFSACISTSPFLSQETFIDWRGPRHGSSTPTSDQLSQDHPSLLNIPVLSQPESKAMQRTQCGGLGASHSLVSRWWTRTVAGDSSQSSFFLDEHHSVSIPAEASTGFRCACGADRGRVVNRPRMLMPQLDGLVSVSSSLSIYPIIRS